MAERLRRASQRILSLAFRTFQIQQAPPRETHAVHVSAHRCAIPSHHPRATAYEKRITMLILGSLHRPFVSRKCQIRLWRTSLSSRDTHVVLATGGLMGTHVILRSRFFLPFTGREDAHVSKWIVAFFLQASSSQQPPGRECRACTPHHG